MEHFNLIIKNATICTMDADMRVIQNGYVAVKGSDIATIAEGQVPGGSLCFFQDPTHHPLSKSQETQP